MIIGRKEMRGQFGQILGSDFDNFFIPQSFYCVFDFAVWNGKVYDVVCDSFGFLWVFDFYDEDYFH
jgi:hypothetical protein